MGFTEDELFEAFGLEPDRDDPEESGTQSDGSEEPDAETGASEGGEPQEPEETEPETEPVQAPEGVQSAQEQARQEAIRRQAEAQAQQQARQEALDEAYRNAFAGRINPYTGRPILNQADFLDYKAAQDAERGRRQAEKLEKAGIDRDALSGMVESLPVIQQARQAMEQARQETARAQAEQARAWFSGQLREIADLGLDADVASLDDLARKYPDKYPEMLRRVSQGATLAEAYRTVNFDAILEKRTAAAKQAALNSTAGRAKLKVSGPGGGQGAAAIEVPADVQEMYRDLNPGITDAEIRKEYGEFLRVCRG